jgi:hypothetical protein
MIAVLDSRRHGPRRRLRYRLSNVGDPDGSGARGAVRDLLLQKADGSYWLALWQDSTVWDGTTRTDIANPAAPVRVTFGRRMSLATYRPAQGRSATLRRTARAVTVDVGDDIVLIALR